MSRVSSLLAACLLLAGAVGGATAEEVLIIGHHALPKADKATVQRIYTGRSVSIGQHAVAPANLPAGYAARDEFLRAYLEQTEEQYTGYWLVRRYVGKGAPPLELGSVEEVLKYVQGVPGAVGYVPVSQLPRGANVIFRR
ncbi:hypothetical protein LZ012_06085 [Dechloromonas sp. XY25]|uniref:Phosphate ABC transporter substrate-binding protein n=1 Tax=Dechloromonas hankyongensis TaxID=2908002 RepID=A0ABS9K093_9RHOO|nr:hypothetical protein [Dechloromonas hankyongensis]MCG2576563.1 hypothetical protein [Dechloromonas hankyongensis]